MDRNDMNFAKLFEGSTPKTPAERRRDLLIGMKQDIERYEKDILASKEIQGHHEIVIDSLQSDINFLRDEAAALEARMEELGD